MQIYKKGQGSTARWIAAVAFGALAGFGCYELRNKASEWQWAQTNVFGTVSVSVILAGVVFVGALLAIGWLLNLPRFVDYLIVSEVELRKVSWPTKAELKRQTTVVIVTLLMFSAILMAADFLFGKLSMTFIIGQ